jgi:hypothetical protein
VTERFGLAPLLCRGRALLRPAIALCACAVLAACATFRSYNMELTRTLDLAGTGALTAALDSYESYNKRGKKDLLYYFEKGELLRLSGRFAESQAAWFEADALLQTWEDTARLHPERVVRDLGSILVSDRLRPYDGSDFEKVMLTARIALNHIALGEWDQARVAIRRTHEREALIAELRAKQVASAEEEAKKRGSQQSFKELNGYPVETIDSPEVNALRNSYQSAFSHYLAGFVYEALGEPSLAAPGYRQAIELRPGVPLLEEALAGLDQRVFDRSSERTDLLVVIENGSAPARLSTSFNLPVFSGQGMLLVPVSMPVLRPASGLQPLEAIEVADAPRAEIAQITSVDLMARRQLLDEMPWIALRSFARATAKGVLQAQALKHDDSGIAGALAIIGTIVTEQADERTWRTLPAEISVARVSVPAGPTKLALFAGSGRHEFEVNVSGRYALVCIRMINGYAYLVAPRGKEAVAASKSARLS